MGLAMELSLEEIYAGCSKVYQYEKDAVCARCRGRGASRIDVCSECQGSGMRVTVRQVAPGYVQQVQMPCGACGGQGATVPPGAHCTACRGSGLGSTKVKLSVNVPPGCPSRKRFVFEGQADEAPNMQTGDIIIELREKTHPHFRRLGNKHLLYSRKVSLLDALSGVKFTVKHLDGSDLEVQCPDGAVVRPGDFFVVKGRGMPEQTRSGKPGDLFVHFDVEFPETLPKGQGGLRDQLRPLLDPSAPVAPGTSKGMFGGMFGAGQAGAAAVTAARISKKEAEDVNRILERERQEEQAERRPHGGADCQQM